jgi:4-hydroxy-3-polyprenylbenzoate decarboxylase
MYKDLKQALLDLEKAGMLSRVYREVDPYLEMAEIARQAFENKGPAILFEHVKGSPFRAVCNIFGTQERIDFLFATPSREPRRRFFSSRIRSNSLSMQTRQRF